MMAHERLMSHYGVARLDGLHQVRSIFRNGANDLNWLVASTSGVHGNYGTLDALENDWKDSGNDEDRHRITLLVIQPRLCALYYGHVEVTRDDIPWLRTIIAQSLQSIRKSQDGNLPQL